MSKQPFRPGRRRKHSQSSTPAAAAGAAGFTVDEFDPERPEPHFIEVLMERNGEMLRGTQRPRRDR